MVQLVHMMFYTVSFVVYDNILNKTYKTNVREHKKKICEVMSCFVGYRLWFYPKTSLLSTICIVTLQTTTINHYATVTIPPAT